MQGVLLLAVVVLFVAIYSIGASNWVGVVFLWIMAPIIVYSNGEPLLLGVVLSLLAIICTIDKVYQKREAKRRANDDRIKNERIASLSKHIEDLIISSIRDVSVGKLKFKDLSSLDELQYSKNVAFYNLIGDEELWRMYLRSNFYREVSSKYDFIRNLFIAYENVLIKEREILQRELSLTNKEIDSMSGIEFEKLICNLFSRKGYSTELTKVTGDNGVDIIAILGSERFAIQCKRYARDRAVGNEDILKLTGALSLYRCNKAHFITSSKYTKQAKEVASKLRVVLWDRETLERELDLHFHMHGTPGYAEIRSKIEAIDLKIDALGKKNVWDALNSIPHHYKSASFADSICAARSHLSPKYTAFAVSENHSSEQKIPAA